MEYRTLGRTGLEISSLGLGTSPFGGVFGEADESECLDCLHRALDLGINYVDTAPLYGLGLSERVLGQCLRDIPRDRYILSTKVGRYGNHLEDFDFSADRVRQSVDESLERLGVDQVDIIFCHDIEYGYLPLVIEEAIPALREVVRLGKARFVGVSGLPIAVFYEVMERSEVDVVLSYCHHTLSDTSLKSLVPELQRRKVGLINAAPMGMGLFTDQGPREWHPAPDELRKACRLAVEHCRSRGTSLARLALQFSTTETPASTTLVGSARAEEIAENTRWIEEPIDQALLAEVLEILHPVHNLTWPTGRPENSQRSSQTYLA